MQRYILKRVVQALVTVIGISIITFCLVRLSGDPTITMLPPDVTPADRELFIHELGLDKPIITQYGIWLVDALHGDLGDSLSDRRPALPKVLQYLLNSLQLVAVSLVFSLGVGLAIGIGAAARQGSHLDRFARYFAILGQSAPTFWVGIILIMLFSVVLKVLPTSGKAGFETFLMPAFTLGWFSMAAVTRISNSAMIAALNSDYIKLARAQGTPRNLIIFKYAFKNAGVVVLTMTSLQLIGLIAGTVIVETVFAWPGLGRLAVTSIFARDYPVVQAFTLVFAVLFTSINLVVDILYAYIDPRVRYE